MVSVTLSILLELELNLIWCYKDNEDVTTIYTTVRRAAIGIIRMVDVQSYRLLDTAIRKKNLETFTGKN